MRKLMKYVKQYTWQSIICPILMVGEVVLELMLPYYMSYIIDVGISERRQEVHYRNRR